MYQLDDFQGDWRLDRVITDRYAGQSGVLSGTVTFADNGPGRLRYAEAGQLRIGQGPVMQAARGYGWQFGADQVDVTFADGSPFHSFVPYGHVAGTDHPCGADFYTVRYDFTRWPDWRATWAVTGPRKDYTSVSDYCR